MERARAEELLAQLGGDWQVREHGHLFLEKSFAFKDFAQALDFVNRVGALAERHAHHPDVYLSWGRVRLRVWTHTIGGLGERDFAFAAECERL